MVNYNEAKALARFRDGNLKSKLSTFYATKLDAMAARMYADDAELRRGAMSAPRSQSRPGQRDDEVLCPFTGLIPAL